MRSWSKLVLAAITLLGLSLGGAQAGDKLTGMIKVDGSSTVYLITEAMAANFKKLHPGVNISVGIAGTGGGFKKFAAGETDINDASRPIKPAEADNCKKKGISYLELQVAWDGLAIIINPENSWAKKLTLEQLKKIWHPNAGGFKNATLWSDVDPSWPKEEIKLYGADADSGTFDYFTEAVNGKEKVIRDDYQASADDNVTTNGVIRNKYGIGFLGVAYYEGSKEKLGVAAIAAKEGGEHYVPNQDTVLSKKYPLSRPLFIYVKTDSLKRPEVQEFCQFYMRRNDLVEASKYVPLNSSQLLRERKKLDSAVKSLE